MKPEDITECPECSSQVYEALVEGRNLAKHCRNRYECGWVGPSYSPPKRPVKNTKYYYPTDGDGWTFEIFDNYGQFYSFSEDYRTEKLCLEEAKKSLTNIEKDPDMANCTAIIWPPHIKVKGTKITSKGKTK